MTVEASTARHHVRQLLRPADRGVGQAPHLRHDPRCLAVDETSVILLHPRLPLVGVSILMERGCH